VPVCQSVAADPTDLCFRGCRRRTLGSRRRRRRRDRHRSV